MCWATATAIGLGIGTVVTRRRASVLMLTLGGVLGSAGSSAAPIAMGFANEGDWAHWGIVTVALAVMGSVIGSLAAASVGRGIIASSLLGARSGCCSGGVIGTCYAGFLIAHNEGHPIAFVYAPVIILLAIAIGTAYGALFALMFVSGCWMIRSESTNSRPAKFNN